MQKSRSFHGRLRLEIENKCMIKSLTYQYRYSTVYLVFSVEIGRKVSLHTWQMCQTNNGPDHQRTVRNVDVINEGYIVWSDIGTNLNEEIAGLKNAQCSTRMEGNLQQKCQLLKSPYLAGLHTRLYLRYRDRCRQAHLKARGQVQTLVQVQCIKVENIVSCSSCDGPFTTRNLCHLICLTPPPPKKSALLVTGDKETSLGRTISFKQIQRQVSVHAPSSPTVPCWISPILTLYRGGGVSF